MEQERKVRKLCLQLLRRHKVVIMRRIGVIRVHKAVFPVFWITVLTELSSHISVRVFTPWWMNLFPAIHGAFCIFGHELGNLGYPAHKFEELDKDHVFGTIKVPVHVLHSDLRKAPAGWNFFVCYYKQSFQRMRRCHFFDQAEKFKGVLKGEKSFVVDNLWPAWVHSSQNCHVVDQDFASLLVLDDYSEFQPCPLHVELWN